MYPSALDNRLSEIASDKVGLHRPFPPEAAAVPIGEVARYRWNLLSGDLLLPAMVLKQAALESNIQVLARYCLDRKVSLAPHAKTTMAPQILAMQQAAGAWAFTVATIHQLRVLDHFGFRRLVLANELVQPAALRWICDRLRTDESLEIYCLADSVEAVELMDRVLAQYELRQCPKILIELGLQGGRTGCRSVAQARDVAHAVSHCNSLVTAGVECFEGILVGSTEGSASGAVDRLLARVRSLTEDLARIGAFAGVREVVVSAGGSAYFDRVVETMERPLNLGKPVRTVLRAGCYVSHDSAFYERVSPMGASRRVHGELTPAIEVWASVLSRPESGLAIVGMGKRDCSYDIDLPVPVWVYRNGSLIAAPDTWQISRLDDQHAYLRTEGDAGSPQLVVGDVIGFGISHPCTTFDKWTLIPVVDEHYNVIDAFRTYH